LFLSTKKGLENIPIIQRAMDYHSSLLYLSIIENIIKGSGKIYEKTGRVFIVLLLCFVGDTACSKSISDHTNQVIGEKNNSKAPGLVGLDNLSISARA
jgi:hypothetical protein